jgi:hypothetical protein
MMMHTGIINRVCMNVIYDIFISGVNSSQKLLKILDELIYHLMKQNNNRFLQKII